MKVKVISWILLMVLVFVSVMSLFGCANQKPVIPAPELVEPEPEPEPDPIEDPEPPNGGGLIILQGTTLKELNLELNIEKLQRFEDHNQEQISYYVNNYSAEHKKYAKTSGLLVEFSEYLGSELLLSIQGFKKPARQDAHQFIEVDSILYDLSDLTQYKLYEDDETIVFDITDLLPEKFADRVQTWIDNGYSCQWMFEVYEYVKTYDDIVITRLGE